MYGLGRTGATGRVAGRVNIAALGWRDGGRLTLTADARVMIAPRPARHDHCAGGLPSPVPLLLC
jgi:hypothetical protein